MRIVQVVCVFPPYKSGIGLVAYYYAQELFNLGHESAIITPQYSPEEVAANEEFTVVRLRPWLKLGKGAFLPQLAKLLNGYDIVHLHYPFFGGAEVVWLLKLLSKKSFRLFVHYHMDVRASNFLTRLLSQPSNLSLGSLLKNADGISCASIDYVKCSKINRYYMRYQGKFTEIPFGVNISDFKPSESPSFDNKILFVGGLDKAHYFKGVEILLQAVAKIKNLDWHLSIVGEGDLKPRYQRIAKYLKIDSQVIFLGAMANAKLVKQYQDAAMLVLPSINTNEAFGLVLLEAMATGTPVVASNLPGVRSVFTDGREGLLVEPGSVTDLKEKVEVLLSDKKLRDSMGLRGRELVEKKYNWRTSAEKLEKIYQAVL